MKKKISLGVFANPGTVIVNGTKYASPAGKTYRSEKDVIVGPTGHALVTVVAYSEKRCPFTRFAGELAFGALFLLACGIVILWWRCFL